jgi:large subunit ribosomal protein L6
MASKDYRKEIDIPEGISVSITDSEILVEGNGSKLSKFFLFGNLNAKVEGNKVVVTSPKNTKRSLKIAGTFNAIINNLFEGIQTGFIYKLKICSGHFPMNVSVSGNELTIKNFLGEAVPRKTKFSSDATVKIEGDIVVIESKDKEVAGQTAGKIESLTKIKNRDSRIFQDGVYIIQKHNKQI